MATKDSCRETGKVLKFWMLWIFSFLPLTLAIDNNISRHDLEIMNHLKRLNKPYVKSIKSPDGDIIDCVLIHLQPAFDNPLLKNHTIQMQPSSYPKGFSSNQSTNEKPLTQLWETKGSCPEGTIPIRRTTKDHLLRVRSLQRYGKKTPQSIPNPNSPPDGQTNDVVHEYAVRAVGEGLFYGAKAGIGVWNPRVQEENEFSLAQIWVLAGYRNFDLNTIEAGWQVYRYLYGDDRTRLFGFWTRDAYKTTGCYNLDCSGFVHIAGTKALGASVSPISSYKGEQYKITMFIFKDRNTGDWWLQYQDILIGYWPKILFTHLQYFASFVNWGGEIVNRDVGGKHTTTEMGSGRFSDEGYTKTANFIELEVVDKSNALITPVNLRTIVTNSGCYDLRNLTTEYWGELFYYGGPGRNPNCR